MRQPRDLLGPQELVDRWQLTELHP
jgi:hypothetical protein